MGPGAMKQALITYLLKEKAGSGRTETEQRKYDTLAFLYQCLLHFSSVSKTASYATSPHFRETQIITPEFTFRASNYCFSDLPPDC